MCVNGSIAHIAYPRDAPGILFILYSQEVMKIPPPIDAVKGARALVIRARDQRKR